MKYGCSYPTGDGHISCLHFRLVSCPGDFVRLFVKERIIFVLGGGRSDIMGVQIGKQTKTLKMECWYLNPNGWHHVLKFKIKSKIYVVKKYATFN